MPTVLDDFVGSDVSVLLDVSINSLWSKFSPEAKEEEAKEKVLAIQNARLSYESRTVKTIFGHQPASSFSDNKSVFRAVSNWVDISCWHTDSADVESMAMWKIYGGSAASVCVESTVGALVNSMIIPAGLEVHAGKVSYVDYEKDYIGVDDPLQFFFNKSKHYEFEKEFRFVLHPNKLESLLSARAEFGTSIPVEPKSVIESVVVSPAATDWFFDLINLIMKDAGYSVNIARSKIPLR
ncbi:MULTISPECIES: DUF2971 domain-containing protein [Pseudomonas syringae group]|uniref:DUF2971 domain-containing protein n=1 Tax=Pseudomonas syringae group TaxID=136849 RepID=UPI0006ABA878|nr:DUF2971 domain-containing protein [Pseudomonas coronafaciens]